ncbi:hypothetical protein BH23ACT11_BH23ACT11_28580 [soil metagenome]
MVADSQPSTLWKTLQWTDKIHHLSWRASAMVHVANVLKVHFGPDALRYKTGDHNGSTKGVLVVIGYAYGHKGMIYIETANLRWQM